MKWKEFIWFFFILYGLSAEIFERILYFNELLALSGLLFFTAHTLFQKQGFIILPKEAIYRLVVIFLLWCSIQLLISIALKTNWYYYLRNSVICYSAFSFFLGYYAYESFVALWKRVYHWVFSYIACFLIYPSSVFLERFTTAFFFPLFFKKLQYRTIFFIFVLNCILAIRYSSLTITVVALALVFILLINSYAHFKLFILSGILAFAIFFSLFIPNFKLYQQGQYHLYGQGDGMNAVVSSHFLLSLDYNTTWRTVFWYRTIVENFPNNLIGIGFGTPLISYKEGYNTAESPYTDEHDAHVTGCHNTYITLFARLGLPFILIISLIFRNVFREFYTYKHFYATKKEGMTFAAFITISIIGCFNLLLESPTAAAVFWVLLGMLSRITYLRKYQSNKSLA
jgi:hypothetical protein